MSEEVLSRKERIEQCHAVRRAKERYGIKLSAEHVIGILNQIEGGKCAFIRVDRPGVSEYRVNFEGKSLRVVYDRVLRQLVTILPPEPPSATLADIMPCGLLSSTEKRC